MDTQGAVLGDIPVSLVERSNDGTAINDGFNLVQILPNFEGLVLRVIPTPATSVSATKSATVLGDASGGATAHPGDTIRYEIEITNEGDERAKAVRVFDGVDPQAPLVAGSLTTTRGTIVSGSAACDTRVEVAIEVMEPGERVTVAFDTVVDFSVVENQAFVKGRNFHPASTDVTSVLLEEESAQDLAVCEDERIACDSDFAVCEGAFAGCTLALGAAIADTDGDAVLDVIDQCARGTAEFSIRTASRDDRRGPRPDAC